MTGWKLPSFRPQNYTALVRRLRIALPIAAVCMLAVVIIWPHFDPAQAPKRHVNAAPPEMNHSHFSGVDKKNRPYTIIADRAVQQSGNDIDLTNPVGKLILQNGAWVTISAKQAQYREDPGVISLKGDVTLTHANGYTVTTSAALVNFDDGIASSDQPTQGKGERGTIEGQGFQLIEDGDKIIFTGQSRLVMLPDQDDDTPETPPADQDAAPSPVGASQ